jgi:glucokinase
MPSGGHTAAANAGRRRLTLSSGEQHASGRALVAEARALATASPAIAATLLALAGGRARGIDGRMVTAAAREGDGAALECFRIVNTLAGPGHRRSCCHPRSRRVHIAEGVSQAGDLIRKPAWQACLSRLTGRAHRQPADLRIAQLGGDEAGVIGAGDLARQR